MKKCLVNYDTKWTNEDITPEESCYFKAYTPIEEIVPKLETEINHRLSRFQENYQTKSTHFYFYRLYRNLMGSYKGWQVFYRKPNSQENYGSITERIGYKPRAKKKSLKRTVLTKNMRWTHDLDPLIGQVEMKGADSCETIAICLNEKIKQPDYQHFFNRFKIDFDSLEKTYQTCNQNLSTFDGKTNAVCQTFCHDLENLARYSKPLHDLTSKDYSVQASNISDVLEQNNILKSAKGWRVEMLD